jgi:hypothetical protein
MKYLYLAPLHSMLTLERETEIRGFNVRSLVIVILACGSLLAWWLVLARNLEHEPIIESRTLPMSVVWAWIFGGLALLLQFAFVAKEVRNDTSLIDIEKQKGSPVAEERGSSFFALHGVIAAHIAIAMIVTMLALMNPDSITSNRVGLLQKLQARILPLLSDSSTKALEKVQ